MLSVVVSGDCVVLKAFVVVVDCDVSPGCAVVVSSVDPLCNVVVAAVVSFPEGDVASVEDWADGTSVTFVVVSVTWGDVAVATVVELFTKDKLDTSTTADIITAVIFKFHVILMHA